MSCNKLYVTPHENAGTLAVHDSVRILGGSTTMLFVDGDVKPVQCRHQQPVVHVWTDPTLERVAFNSITLFPFAQMYL